MFPHRDHIGASSSGPSPPASFPCPLGTDFRGRNLHDVPPAVFELLRELGRLAPQPLTVIIERDGRYPPTARLLEQLDDARAALAAGREVGP
jgi:hypothetical protein